MIHHKTGNILDAPVEAIVIPVNCVGVMGAGLAKQFVMKYPELEQSYKRFCLNGMVRPGGTVFCHAGNRGIFFAATKNHWRQPSRIEWMGTILESIRMMQSRHDLKSIAIPALGCGLGGLDWADVLPLIEAAFADVECEVWVYGPQEGK